MVSHTHNPSYFRKQEQKHDRFEASLCNLVRSCFKIKHKKGWGYSTALEHLPSKHEALDPIPSTAKKRNDVRWTLDVRIFKVHSAQHGTKDTGWAARRCGSTPAHGSGTLVVALKFSWLWYPFSIVYKDRIT